MEASTHEDYVRWARLYVKPFVGAIPLDVLAPEDVEDMMSALEAQGLSAPKTVKTAPGTPPGPGPRRRGPPEQGRHQRRRSDRRSEADQSQDQRPSRRRPGAGRPAHPFR